MQHALRLSFALAALTAAPHAQALLESLPGPAGTSNYGSALADAGDVDADGVSDFLVGDHQANQGGGRVEVRSGVDGGLLRAWDGTPGSDEWSGYAVAGIGDLDGDGFAEVAYSAPDFLDGQGTAHVYVKHGATGTNLFVLSGNQAYRYGFALAGGGDADGDGNLELLIGSPDFTTAFLPYAHGLVTRVEFEGGVATTDAYVGPDADAPSGFGRTLAWLGDVDGDGGDEFAVGAPFWSAQNPFLPSTEFGRVDVLDASHATLWTRIGPFANQDHGEALANVGDVDGDGAAELAVGSSGVDGFKGYVEVLSGVSGAVLASRIGPTHSRFGRSIAGLGDVDGDGSPELLVGAPWQELFTSAPALSGTVHVVRADDLTTVRSRGGASSDEYLGQSVAALTDLTGDGVREVLTTAFGTSGEADQVLVLDPTGETAYVQAFGAGLAGTLGIPILQCNPAPVLGTTSMLFLDNSSGTPQLGALFAGQQETVVPFYGGFLFMVPTIVQWLPTVPPGGLLVPLPVSSAFAIAGSRFVVQGLQLDPGAVQGVSISPPIALGIAGS